MCIFNDFKYLAPPTYMWVDIFKNEIIKSKYKVHLSDKLLQAMLLIGTTKFDANYQEILKDKQFQTSHCVTYSY